MNVTLFRAILGLVGLATVVTQAWFLKVQLRRPKGTRYRKVAIGNSVVGTGVGLFLIGLATLT